jgi:hypothetical protein
VLLRLDRADRHGLRPRRSRPGVLLWTIGALCGALIVGCRRDPPGTTARLVWTLSPDPPRVGPAVLSLFLADPDSKPVAGARWRLEGHMTHPGMPPVLADATAVGAGRYEARLTFTMAGDWVVLAEAEWGSSERLERSLPVRVAP